MHEPVQAAGFLDQVLARAQVQVVGVGKQNLRAHAFHGLRRHGFDGRLGTHGHIAGGVDIAVRRMHAAQPRARVRTDLQQLEGKTQARASFANSLRCLRRTTRKQTICVMEVSAQEMG